MIENAPWYVVGAVLSFVGYREWKKTRVVDSAVDQGLRIKDGSIATLENEVERLRKLVETTRGDQFLFLKQKREADQETEALRTKLARRLFLIERDRDILRGVVKDLVADVRKVKRHDMPLAELNTGLLEDIELSRDDS